MKKIFITDYIKNPDIEKKIFENQAEVYCLNERDEKKFPEEISQADGLLVWHTKISEITFKKLKKHTAVVRYGVGYENIDLKAAEKYGVIFANTPDYGVDEVADTTCAMILNFVRKISLYNDRTKKYFGNWQAEVIKINKDFPIKRTSDHKLGIIGMGRIGSSVAIKLKSFNMEVGFYDPHKESGYEKVFGIKRYDSLEDLKKNSTIISINATLTNETKKMINKQFIETLNENTILINTARGAIIENLDIIFKGLQSKKIAAVGLDVLPEEPPSKNEMLIKAWLDSNQDFNDRIIVNPHAGYYSTKSLVEMRSKASNNLLNYIKNKKLVNVIKYKP